MVDEGMIFSMADQKWQDMQGRKYRPKPSWAAETRGRGGPPPHTHTWWQGKEKAGELNVKGAACFLRAVF